MLYNLLIVWLILLMIFFQGFIKQSSLTKLLFLFISGLTLAMISAFRFETSGDFYTNYIGFIKTSSMSFKEILFNYDEYGHMLLRKVISLFAENPQWYFVISGLFIVISFLIFIYRYSPNVYLSVLLFVTIGGYFTSHNITRQYIAIAICLYAIPYLISRKPIKYFFVTIMAMTFHTSAVVMIPIYFLAKVSIKRKVIVLYIVTITLITLIYDALFPYLHNLIYSDYYTEGSYGTTGANFLNIILPTLLLILLWYFYHIWKKNATKNDALSFKPQEYILYNSLVHMGVLSFFFSLVGVTNMLILSRLSDYFMVCYLIIIPWALKFSVRKKRIIIYFCIFILTLTYFLINNYLGRLTPTPYTPFWWY